MATQFGAVTSRRIRPAYVDMINAQTPYLHDKYRLKDDMAFRDKKFAFEKESADRGFAFDKEKFESDTAFSAEQLEEQKKQAKKASLLGVGNLGLMYGMMSDRNKVLSDIYGASEPAKDTIAPAISSPRITDFGDAPAGDINIGAGAGAAGHMAGLTDAATSWQPYAAGLTGATVGADLGEKYVPFGGKKEKRIIGGAVTGGGLGYMLSGGNPYATAISAIIGGGGGGFF